MQGSVVSTSKIEKTLDFQLTEAEFADRGKTASKLSKEIQELKASFAASKNEWKGRIELKEGELRAVQHIIRSGVEPRSVHCEMQKDYDKGKIAYVFEGKVIEERPMEPHEAQVEMEPETVGTH